jgi:hypothetical protein
MEVTKESMGKKRVEKRVNGAKEELESQFPMKPKDQFLALREWLEENQNRDIMKIVEDDRKLIYGKLRQKALDGVGNMEALKVIFNKVFPDIKVEPPGNYLGARQLIQLYVKVYGPKEQEEPEDKKDKEDKPDGETS